MSTHRQLSPSQRIRDAVLSAPSVQAVRDADPTSVRRGGPDLPLQPSTWSIRATLAALLSFELLFVLFLSAGRIKASPYLAWMPVDMTGLFFALSVIVGSLVALTKKVNRRGVLTAAAMGAFVAWLVASLAWSPGVVYAHEKALGSILGFWACTAAAVIIAADRARVRRVLSLLVLVALWFAIEGMFAYATAEKRWYLDIGGTDYTGLANTVGHGAVIVVATLITVRRPAAFRLMLAALLALFFFVILVAGKRQPLLGLVGVLLLAAFMGFRPAPGGIAFNRFQRAAWGILLAAMVAIVIAIASGQSFTLGRISRLLDAAGPDNSAATRQIVMAQAVQFWTRAPIFGNGVGSFPILENWVTDERRHPHNVFLEALCELGLVGFVLFGVFLLSALRWVKLQRLRGDPLLRCVFLLVMFDLSHAMVGQDLGENRLLYAMLGLLALPAAQGMSAASERRPAARLEGRFRQATSGGVGRSPS